MSRAARLGIFIILTLSVLAAGIFIIGSKQYLFTSTYRLKTQFATVVGLDAGADVRVGGVHSGTVRGIELPHFRYGDNSQGVGAGDGASCRAADTSGGRGARNHE